MYLLILFIILPIVLYFKQYKPFQYWKNKQVPYDSPWPIFGNIGRFALGLISIPDWLQTIYNNYNCRYIGFYQFAVPTLLIKDLDLLKQVAIKDFDSFSDHRVLLDESAEPLLKNLLSLKGQKWKEMRSTLSPAFTASKMRAMFQLISECAEQFTNHFTHKANVHQPITIEMKDVYTRYANDVIATCAFGIKCDSLEERENEFYTMGKAATNFSARYFVMIGYEIIPAIMRFFKVRLFTNNVVNFFTGLIRTTIRTRKEQAIIRPDLIHLLMEARKGKLRQDDAKHNERLDGFATVEEFNIGTETSNKKAELSDDDITAQAILFFIGGFETTSTLLCFMAYELALNMDVQQKLQEEIDKTLGECNEKVTYETIQSMKYLDMVVSETLRKWPPAAVTDRVCTKPFTIEPVAPNERPVTLNKDDAVWFPIYPIHRDPQYYPNPDKFDPERFSDENKSSIKPFTYIPFGIGPRNCIGSRFALMEAKIIFVQFLSKFDLVVVDKTPIPLQFSRKQFNVSSANGFWLGLKLRTFNTEAK